MNRVVVTGLGCISAIGRDVPSFWSSLCNGHCGIGTIPDAYAKNGKPFIGAQVTSLDPSVHFTPHQVQLLDRFSQFALIAAQEAIGDSHLELKDELRMNTAVILGTGHGGMTGLIEATKDYYEKYKGRVHPLTIPKIMTNAAVSHITMEYKIHGPAYTIVAACASANHAIANAFWLINTGFQAVAIVGGTEACFIEPYLLAWESMRVLAPDTCRPFSLDRKGMVLGEGAGMLVMEAEDHAVRRGAKIYAELAGFGLSSDAFDISKPSIAGEVMAMQNALQTAKLNRDEIDYVNAHGTGTKLNDVTETAALHRTFAGHAGHLAISSTKSMHGHALGASGALEAIATILAVQNNMAPPTVNFTKADPECDLDYIPNQARSITIDAALSNAFGFGGLNAVLAFKKYNSHC